MINGMPELVISRQLESLEFISRMEAPSLVVILLEFAYMRKLTTKVDVFSFGMIVMEFITRKRPTGLTEAERTQITLPQLVDRALSDGQRADKNCRSLSAYQLLQKPGHCRTAS